MHQVPCGTFVYNLTEMHTCELNFYPFKGAISEVPYLIMYGFAWRYSYFRLILKYYFYNMFSKLYRLTSENLIIYDIGNRILYHFHYTKHDVAGLDYFNTVIIVVNLVTDMFVFLLN